MDTFDYLHIAIGSCRYGKFKVGDIVEISSEGYIQGIHEFHVDCFGEVTKIQNGLLSVIIYGEDTEKEYHPCYWYISNKENYRDWKEEQEEINMSYC